MRRGASAMSSSNGYCLDASKPGGLITQPWMVLPPEENANSCAAPVWRPAIRAALGAVSTTGAGAASTAYVTTSSAPAAVERTETARPLSAREKSQIGRAHV